MDANSFTGIGMTLLRLERLLHLIEFFFMDASMPMQFDENVSLARGSDDVQYDRQRSDGYQDIVG